MLCASACPATRRHHHRAAVTTCALSGTCRAASPQPAHPAAGTRGRRRPSGPNADAETCPLVRRPARGPPGQGEEGERACRTLKRPRKSEKRMPTRSPPGWNHTPHTHGSTLLCHHRVQRSSAPHAEAKHAIRLLRGAARACPPARRWRLASAPPCSATPPLALPLVTASRLGLPPPPPPPPQKSSEGAAVRAGRA